MSTTHRGGTRIGGITPFRVNPYRTLSIGIIDKEYGSGNDDKRSLETINE